MPNFRVSAKQDCSFVFLADVLPKALGEIYLWSKVVCFVLFCHAKISQTMALHAVLLVSSESFWWVGMHQVALRLFGVRVWKLLIIEPFVWLDKYVITLWASYNGYSLKLMPWCEFSSITSWVSMNIHRRKVDGCGCKILPSLKEEKNWEGSYEKNGFSFKIA